MADIRPFQGVHYNPSKIKDLSGVICPPYDIITPQLQQELYERSDYNFVRIEYSRELPQDKDTFNKYTRAGATFKDWLDKRILVRDESPSLYIHEHTFVYQGRTLKRFNINCLVRLEDWSRMVIRPHEGTLTRARSDRLNMLWTLQANTSPVMSLYEDKDKEIASILKRQLNHKPILQIPGADGESHRIWAVTDEKIIERIKDRLSGQPLYIADGHHRYESALVYQRERRSASPEDVVEVPYDFVLMTLVDIADPGLIILPAHRLLRGMEQLALDDLLARMNAFFDVKDYVLRKDIKSQINKLISENENKVNMLLCGLKPGHIQVISVRDFKAIRPMFPAFHSEHYQHLDVSIVDHVILEELLGLSHEKAGNFLDYNFDAETAIKKVLNQEYQLGIIVNPIKPRVIKTIADSSDRMPHKSTYFYPKVPAGLLSYRFA